MNTNELNLFVERDAKFYALTHSLGSNMSVALLLHICRSCARSSVFIGNVHQMAGVQTSFWQQSFALYEPTERNSLREQLPVTESINQSINLFAKKAGCQWDKESIELAASNGHIWNPQPQFVYSLWHFYGAPMKNKGCLLMRPLTLKVKSSENFLSPAPKVPNFGVFRFCVYMVIYTQY